MQITFLWKDEVSNTGNCASLGRAVRDGRDGYVVNGVPVSGADYQQIPETGPGERAVWVPANVLERLRDLP